MTEPSWKTVRAPWRLRFPRRVVAADAPPISIVPVSGATVPLAMPTKVDLPEPFSPTRAWTSPGDEFERH